MSLFDKKPAILLICFVCFGRPQQFYLFLCAVYKGRQEWRGLPVNSCAFIPSPPGMQPAWSTAA